MTLVLPGIDAAPCDADKQRVWSQWYTPPDLAARLVQWALAVGAWRVRGDGMLVLEPSCGRGALVEPLLADRRVEHVTAVDIDPANVAHLARSSGSPLIVHEACDFLAVGAGEVFDLAVMNPPYEDGADGAHVAHASRFAPRVCALVRLAFLATEGRYREVWRWHRLHRLAILRLRPDFGGDYSAQYDYCCVDVSRLDAPRVEGRPDDVQVEWWP